MTAEQDWDSRYAGEQVFSGRANTALTRHVASLTPGSALDLGCGEGGDALWLAEAGWQVTAVDLSREALRRAERTAAERGLAGRIAFRHCDLSAEFPDGVFDLVSAQFLHSQHEFPRDRILRTAAGHVADGGVLLIEGHADIPAWAGDHGAVDLPSAAELHRRLDLGPGWQVLVRGEHERHQYGPDGAFLGERTDSTLMLRRTG